MANPNPPGDVVGQLRGTIRELEKRLAELERFDGTQNAATVAKVSRALEETRQLLANLDQQVAAAITATSYTRAQIDGLVSNPPDDVTVGGLLKADAGISSIDARNRVVTQGYAATWIDETGRFGISPSSIRFKTDLEPWVTDPLALLTVRSVMFRYTSEAADAPKQLGVIAEELLAAGFPEFVFYDAEGNVQGVNYDRLVVALLELAKAQQAQHDDLATRVANLEGTP